MVRQSSAVDNSIVNTATNAGTEGCCNGHSWHVQHQNTACEYLLFNDNWHHVQCMLHHVTDNASADTNHILAQTFKQERQQAWLGHNAARGMPALSL